MKNKILLATIVLGSTFFVLNGAAEPKASGSTTSSSSGATTTNSNDVNVQIKVQDQISADPLLKHSQIEVDEKGDAVILKGTVNSEKAYERAVMIAYAKKGVQNVDVNQLVLKCTEHPSEDYVTAARVRGILVSEGIIPVEYVHQDFGLWPIQIFITEGGVVTLNGFVENDDLRIRAARIVEKVPNVGSVTTNITVRRGTGDAFRGTTGTKSTTSTTGTTDTGTTRTTTEGMGGTSRSLQPSTTPETSKEVTKKSEKKSTRKQKREGTTLDQSQERQIDKSKSVKKNLKSKKEDSDLSNTGIQEKERSEGTTR